MCTGTPVHRHTCALNLPKKQVTPYQMGTALDYVTTRLLTNAIETHFPSVNPELNPELQFYIHQKDIGSIKYIVKDLDFSLQTPISRLWLEEPTFDLVQWYLQYLEFKHHYSKRYKAKQLELYGNLATCNADNSEYKPTSSLIKDPQLGSSNQPSHLCPCHECEDHSFQTCINSMPVSNNFNTESITDFDWSNIEES